MTKDEVTGIVIEDSFYEKNIKWLEKLLFWTIIFSPYMVILNDIYSNKFVHNNNFWIKRIRLYFTFIVTIYTAIWFLSQLKMQYLPAINLLSIYILMYFILIMQIKFMPLFKAKKEDILIDDNELKNITAVQENDTDCDNKKRKFKYRVIFLVLFVLIYIITFNNDYQSHYLATFVSFVLIVGYDYFEQKYFKRDIIELFWKKRISFYFLFLAPILIIVSFLIYDTLIFKY